MSPKKFSKVRIVKDPLVRKAQLHAESLVAFYLIVRAAPGISDEAAVHLTLKWQERF